MDLVGGGGGDGGDGNGGSSFRYLEILKAYHRRIHRSYSFHQDATFRTDLFEVHLFINPSLYLCLHSHYSPLFI
ncbi:hypothetical protein M0802_007482 [Mischocyttarus mexicanus]|nr:hypothetical protein M0802_007482 [Mischocyttarus mexicanus]